MGYQVTVPRQYLPRLGERTPFFFEVIGAGDSATRIAAREACVILAAWVQPSAQAAQRLKLPFAVLMVTREPLSNAVPACALSQAGTCLLYTSPSPRDATLSRMPSSA